jgi:guanylate kinase
MENKEGKLYILSGPSGTGKGTIVRHLIPKLPQLVQSVSATTRSPRKGEVDGKDYFFITKQRFLQMVSDSEFLEYDLHFENYYGTPKRFVIENLSMGKDVLLEIDVEGALKVKKNYPQSVLIFVMPPSIAELRRRLRARNTESDADIEERLARVEKEINLIEVYDYTVLNDDLNLAVEKVYKIIKEN